MVCLVQRYSVAVVEASAKGGMRPLRRRSARDSFPSVAISTRPLSTIFPPVASRMIAPGSKLFPRDAPRLDLKCRFTP